MANLFIAAFWLTIAALCLVWQWLHPERRVAGMSSTTLAAATGILLAALNVARWWSNRSARMERTYLGARRGHANQPPPSRPESGPDPTFDFSEKLPEDRGPA
jgi:hypothetical protein